ncbi:MAG: hypothetical protein M1828_001092 [Chrysothrix sp. TS-e1954]|nr:MAG: hypothetical protein M1828_001092 [Chrysothrix sp. TS-e1954]
MSLALKITTLFIRTAAKPIANAIKRQARENPPFRRVCVSFAQGLHRLDIRLRLGLLQDTAAIDAQIARDAEREAVKRAAKEAREKARAKGIADGASEQTAKTEAESKSEDAEQAHEKKEISERLKKEAEEKSKSRRAKIRPLSEAKAIDSGATFISETFLFVIGVGAILGERWWSSRKEESRREGVEQRLENLESDVTTWKERALKAEANKKGQDSKSDAPKTPAAQQGRGMEVISVQEASKRADNDTTMKLPSSDRTKRNG